jgi:hypothetical protein
MREVELADEVLLEGGESMGRVHYNLDSVWLHSSVRDDVTALMEAPLALTVLLSGPRGFH